MKHLLKPTLLLVAVALVGISSAQGRRFGMFGGMGGGLQPVAMLVSRADVQRDLNVSTDQKAEIDKAQQEQREAMMERFRSMMAANGGGAPGGSGGGRRGFQMTPEMQAEIDKAMKESDEKVKKILTADQYKRAHQISIQLAKNNAILDESVQKELGLSEETVKKAKSLREGAQKANGEVFQKIGDQEIERADGMAIVEKNNKALETELGKLLTEAQAKKLKEMGGAEFKADEQPQGFRFGGGGR